jgi:hypothetical protein
MGTTIPLVYRPALGVLIFHLTLASIIRSESRRRADRIQNQWRAAAGFSTRVHFVERTPLPLSSLYDLHWRRNDGASSDALRQLIGPIAGCAAA